MILWSIFFIDGFYDVCVNKNHEIPSICGCFCVNLSVRTENQFAFSDPIHFEGFSSHLNGVFLVFGVKLMGVILVFWGGWRVLVSHKDAIHFDYISQPIRIHEILSANQGSIMRFQLILYGNRQPNQEGENCQPTRESHRLAKISRR